MYFVDCEVFMMNLLVRLRWFDNKDMKDIRNKIEDDIPGLRVINMDRDALNYFRSVYGCFFTYDENDDHGLYKTNNKVMQKMVDDDLINYSYNYKIDEEIREKFLTKMDEITNKYAVRIPPEKEWNYDWFIRRSEV